MTSSGVLGAFITKVKRDSIADITGQLKPGNCWCVVMGLVGVCDGFCWRTVW